MNVLSTSQNLDSLIRLYRTPRDNLIALFLGSGVNAGLWSVKHPACASWPKLLEAVGGHFHSPSQLKAILDTSNSEWIGVADKLFHGQAPATVIEKIDEAIYSGLFRDPASRRTRERKHKILPWTVLKEMDTLRAAVSFSAAINNPAKKRSMRRNPKVGMVLTTNYDFFFGAAWPRYTSMQKSWWPGTWASTEPLPEGAGSILYLHGYLPYSSEGQKDVVITQDDYKRAYAEGRFALRKLSEAVDRYHLLFLGFSFSDSEVSDVLRNRASSKEHYAILLEGEPQKLEAARSAGVIPVPVSSWSQIPAVLERIYIAGLSKQELDRTKMTDGQHYWATLQRGLEPRGYAQV